MYFLKLLKYSFIHLSVHSCSLFILFIYSFVYIFLLVIYFSQFIYLFVCTIFILFYLFIHLFIFHIGQSCGEDFSLVHFLIDITDSHLVTLKRAGFCHSLLLLLLCHCLSVLATYAIVVVVASGEKSYVP